MTPPVVSIVIATRDRASKLARLLAHIQEQAFSDFECIVVDDASSEDTVRQYTALWHGMDERFRLVHRAHPGGPAAARNTGIIEAQGHYVAFCDDDDHWTRTDHLAVAVRAMEAEGADFFFSNMQTSIDGQVINPNWFKLLTQRVEIPITGEPDVYRVSPGELRAFLRHRIFHANTMVVARELLNHLGSYWEKVSFAEDHDMSFRLADAAARVLFRTTVTADLDISPHPSVARTYSDQDRVLFGILATLHAEAAMHNPRLRRVVRGNRAWRLLELAELALNEGRPGVAWDFAVQSLLLVPSKRAAITVAKLGRHRLFKHS